MTDTPNLLLLFPDQWRWDWLGGYDGSDTPFGNVPVLTPNLDALAARGTRFTQCRTNSPLCAPARACLATGRRYPSYGVRDNGDTFETPPDTVFARLRDAGYRVAATGKTDLAKDRGWKGHDGWTTSMGRLGFTHAANQAGKWDALLHGYPEPKDLYTQRLQKHGLLDTHHADYQRRHRRGQNGVTLATHASPLPREHYTDDVCGQAAIDLLGQWSAPAHDAPWLLWVNFPGPHEPFDPPAGLRALYDGVDFPGPVQTDAQRLRGDGRHAVEQDHAQIRRNYAAMITGIDQWVGRLLDRVEARGETDRTLVLFCSDHGEMLGDHGRWYKSVPHEGSVHVPLIAAGPGVPKGQLREDPVELIDLAATMLSAAGQATPGDWDARPLFGPDARPRDVQVSALGDWEMACDGRIKLVREAGQSPKLFDLADDPAEMHDVAAHRPDDVARLSAALP